MKKCTSSAYIPRPFGSMLFKIRGRSLLYLISSVHRYGYSIDIKNQSQAMQSNPMITGFRTA